MPARARSDRAQPGAVPLVTAAGAVQAVCRARANALRSDDTHMDNLTRPGGHVSSFRGPNANWEFAFTGRM